MSVKKILVVDDSPLNVPICRNMLVKHGYQIVLATAARRHRQGKVGKAGFSAYGCGHAWPKRVPGDPHDKP